MVKSAERVKEKLEERVAGSGKYHKAGMEDAEVNPNEAALKKLDLMKARFDKAMDSGKTKAGMQKAASDKTWEKRVPVAAARWEESSGYMTDRYMEGYIERADCINEAKKAIVNLPETTIEQRAEKSKQYQIAMSKCMAKKKGLK